VKHPEHWLLLLGTLLIVRPLSAQTLSGDALITALRRGGYILVVRHASSPRDAPSNQTANADNPQLERQLDENGRVAAIAMGQALRNLKIPIGNVFTSPTYRALQTVQFAQLPHPHQQLELGDAGQSMQGISDAQSAWLKKQVTQAPKGTNTVIVTHLPNMAAAFPQWTFGLSDGETLVLRSDGKTGTTLVARIKIEQWSAMKF
jgi:phosphohistidine phosphatase SixA